MSGDVKQGSKVELPLWLGEMLAISYGPQTFRPKLSKAALLTLHR